MMLLLCYMTLVCVRVRVRVRVRVCVLLQFVYYTQLFLDRYFKMAG
jgi:hypothetical protein